MRVELWVEFVAKFSEVIKTYAKQHHFCNDASDCNGVESEVIKD